VPNLDSTKWENYVHAVLWRVGRHFGFQAFNPNPKTAGLVRRGCLVHILPVSGAQPASVCGTACQCVSVSGVQPACQCVGL